MTDEEFARLFPNVKWPQTFEGRDSTYIESVPKLPAAFSDPLITEDTRAPLSIGSFRSSPTTPREIFMDNLSRIFGDDSEGRHRVDNVMKYVDFFGGTLFGAYDTPRALDEGRYKDATLSAINAAAPFLGKPTKLLKYEVRGKFATNGIIDNLASTEPVHNIGQTNVEEPLVTSHTSIGPDLDENIKFGESVIPGGRSTPWVVPFGPLRKEPRDFVEDYAGIAAIDANGNLLEDIDARPLTAKNIAGRRRKGEKDVGLKGSEIRSIVENDLKIPIHRVPRNMLSKKNALGEVWLHPDGYANRIQVWDRLPEDQADVVIAHELSHVIDYLAGKIPISKEMRKELNKLYSENYTGQLRPERPILPKNIGYKRSGYGEEKMAEAIRTAMVNPNTLKTIAPKTAAVLRTLNEHPIISKFLQFNNIPIGLFTGAGATAMMGKESESQAKRPESKFIMDTPDAKIGFRNIASALQSSGSNRPLKQKSIPPGLDAIARAILMGRANASYGDPR